MGMGGSGGRQLLVGWDSGTGSRQSLNVTYTTMLDFPSKEAKEDMVTFVVVVAGRVAVDPGFRSSESMHVGTE